MPYESKDELPPEVQALPDAAQSIFLAAFNSAYSGAWVKKAAAAEETVSSPAIEYELVGAAKSSTPVTLEGPLIQINALNANKWGISSAEVENTILTLKGAPLKICSGEAAIKVEHSCDYNWDPKAEIGAIEDAYEKDGWIHAKAQVTDKVAASKIRDGTWKRKWSIFGMGTPQPDGMRKNFQALSVTLVRRPAYPDAGYNVDAAKGGDGTAKEKDDKKEFSDDEINTMLDWMKANPNKMTDAHKRMMYDVQGAKDRQAWMKEMLDEMNNNPGMIDDDMRTKMRDMMKASASAGASLSKNKMEEHMAEGTEEKKYTQADLDKQLAAAKEEGRLEREKLVAAAIEKAKAEAQEAAKSMMPRAEVEKLIAASVEQAKTATLEQIKKESLISEVAAMQVGAGVIKPEEAEGAKKTLALKSAAALEEDKNLLQRVKTALESAGVAAVNKFKETQLPASAGTGTSAGAAVGGYDPVKKVWG